MWWGAEVGVGVGRGVLGAVKLSARQLVYHPIGTATAIDSTDAELKLQESWLLWLQTGNLAGCKARPFSGKLVDEGLKGRRSCRAL